MSDTDDDRFDPSVFESRIALDDTIRALLIAGAVVGGVVVLLLPGLGVVSTLIAPAALLGLWFWLTLSTARVGRLLPMIGGVLESDPDEARRLIDEALRVRPVMRWARLMTYHRLATLRYLERRFSETAWICLCLLNQPLAGPAKVIRPHLLLMLAEAQLEAGNLPGAYHALAHLQQTRLSLSESLQRLAIQTRYELAVGAYGAALRRSRAKVELAELMPVAPCATMHAMLATAAHHDDRPRLASWLWERTRLLASPDLLGQLERGGFGVGVVKAGPAIDDGPA